MGYGNSAVPFSAPLPVSPIVFVGQVARCVLQTLTNRAPINGQKHPYHNIAALCFIIVTLTLRIMILYCSLMWHVPIGQGQWKIMAKLVVGAA